MSVDIDRLKDAAMNIYIQGCPTTGARMALIEEAISEIQADGAAALKTRYLGIKNYAQFGDQRCDCEYGMGPRHGGIVFRVGRQRNCETVMGENEIYFLLVARDNPGGFGVAERGTRSLSQAIKDLEDAENKVDELRAVFSSASEPQDN